jgi:isopenicillin-N N-acyltransferase-like protein
LNIQRDSKPSISQVTEAGILGKIGLNSSGVGVCLNAIRVRGVDFTRLPAHLALRKVLDSTSRHEAVEAIRKAGVAAAIHILVADMSGISSIEASSVDLVIHELINGKIAHANHFLFPHALKGNSDVPESVERMKRMTVLIEKLGDGVPLAMEPLERILEDEHNAPFGINKAGNLKEPLRTLLSIVMDLKSKSAHLRCGRPKKGSEVILLNPDKSYH